MADIRDDGQGKIQARFRLWDVFSGKQLGGEQFSMRSESWRRVGHIIADAIYERLTGEKGYFDTRVVFIAESGPQGQARQAAGDHGPGRRRICALLTNGQSLVLTPRFSPTTQEITYHCPTTSGQPRVYALQSRQTAGRKSSAISPA